MKENNDMYLIKLFLFMFIISCSFDAGSRRTLIGAGSSSPFSETDKDVIVTSNCVCQGGESLGFESGCPAFCSTKLHAEQMLYITAEVRPEVLRKYNFNTLEEWCSVEREDDSGEVLNENPACLIEAENELDDEFQEFDPVSLRNNEIIFDVGALKTDANYIVTLFEAASGDEATTFSVRKIAPGGGNFAPLARDFVSTYECLRSIIDTNLPNGVAEFELNYYFYGNQPNKLPNPLLQDMTCTDLNGVFLSRINNIFQIWSGGDARFSIEDKMPIEDMIETKLGSSLSELGVDGSLFLPYFHNERPLDEDSDEETPLLGFLMTSFPVNNSGDGVHKCLTNLDYNGPNELYEEIGITIGNIDTTPLYLAQRQDLPLPIDQSLAQNFILVTKQMVQNIWYTKGPNGIDPVGLNPDARTETGIQMKNSNSIYFQHLGFLKDETHGEYRIIHPGKVGENIIPHDKRIGCIPKI